MHLIDQLQSQGQQVVYIKNEIGDADIDTKLLQQKHIQTRELLNGCICCTLVGPFTASLTEVVERYQPDRICIEASGAADPSALALMVSSHPLLWRDGVIGIIDVLNFEGYADLTETTRNQTKFIDLIVFNKVEQATLEQKRRVVGYVRELNSHSPIIEAPHGKVAKEAVFGLDGAELTRLLQSSSTSDNHNHVAHDQFGSFAVYPTGTVSESRIIQFLQTLPPQLFRAKGIVHLDSGAWVVCNMVGGRADLRPLQTPPQNQKNVLIFIGIAAESLAERITEATAGTFSQS